MRHIPMCASRCLLNVKHIFKAVRPLWNRTMYKQGFFLSIFKISETKYHICYIDMFRFTETDTLEGQ